MPDTWTIGEASAALGISREAVRKRLRRGSLKGRKVAGEWRISPVEGVHPAARDGTGHVQDAARDTARDGTGHVQDELVALQQALQQAKLEAAAAKGEVRGLRGRVKDLQTQLTAKGEELRRADHLLAQKEQTLAALVDRVPMLPAPREQGGLGAWWRRVTGKE